MNPRSRQVIWFAAIYVMSIGAIAIATLVSGPCCVSSCSSDLKEVTTGHGQSKFLKRLRPGLFEASDDLASQNANGRRARLAEINGSRATEKIVLRLPQHTAPD